MRLLFVLLSFCLIGLVAAQTIVNCPVDCGVDGDVEAQLDACILTVEECDTVQRAVPRVEWVAVFGTTDIDNTTTSLFIVPLNQTADRIDCLAAFGQNDTNRRDELILVCIEYEFCYTPIDTVLNVQLSGNCFASAFSFPGVQEINFQGPANILGSGFVLDPLLEPNINFNDILFSGGGTTDQLFASRLTNSNITMNNVEFQGYAGEHVIALEACDFSVVWEFNFITIFQGSFRPLYFEGMGGLTVRDYTCSQCVTLTDGECLHVNPSPYAFGDLIIQRVNCFRVSDRLPPRCRYCLDNGCYSRCNDGEVQTFDRINTEIFSNCPIVETSFFSEPTMGFELVEEFDQECRIYRKPSCNFISAASADNFTLVFNFAGGDIIWEFGRDLICGPGGDIIPTPSGGYLLTNFENVLGDTVPVNDLPPLPPPITFTDPNLEAIGTDWQQQSTLNSNNADVWDERGYGPAISNSSDPQESNTGFARVDPRTGNYFFSCKAQEKRSVRQVIQVTPIHAGIQRFQFWAAVSNDDANKLFDRFIRLLIDGMEFDRFTGPQIEATFVADEVYYLFEFDAWNATVGEHILQLECDFTSSPDDGINMWVAIDDVRLDGPANPLLRDKSFEYRSLTWRESRTTMDIIPSFTQAFLGLVPIANIGPVAFRCESGLNTWIEQTTVALFDGVYVLSLYATRDFQTAKNEIEDIGLIASVETEGIVGVQVVTFAPQIFSDNLENADIPYLLRSNNSFVVDTAPVNITVRINCLATAAEPVFGLGLDTIGTEAVGIPNINPSTLGFSSQVVSSAPRIVNDTCDCSNFTAPPRDPSLLPCLYALNETDAICEEEIPFCCVEEEVASSPLFQTVFYEVCDDLGNSSCAFITDCEYNFATDAIFNCTQYVCPDNYLVQNGFAFLNMSQVVLIVGDATVTVDQVPVLSITIDVLGVMQTVNGTMANLVANGIIVDVVVNSSGIHVQVQTPTPIPLQTTTEGDLESICTPQLLSFFNGTILGSATENVTYQPNGTYIYTELNIGWTCPAVSKEPQFFFDLCTDFNTDDCIIFTDCDSISLGQPPNGFFNYFTGCTRLNCTSPDNEPPMFSADFLSCSPYNNNGTILDNETYILADATGGAFIFEDGMVETIQFDTYELFLDLGSECFWVFDRPSISPLVSECQDFPFFRVCPCNENGTYTVPMLPDDVAPGGNLSEIPIGGGNVEQPLDFFYFCTDRMPSCRCNEAAIIASNPPPNGTVGIHIVRIPETMNRVSMVDNRVVDYAYGWIQEQTTFAKITSNTIAIPDYDDNSGVIREIAKNDNEFITGGTWDFVLNEVGSPYQEACTCIDVSPYACCAQDFTREEDFDCLVDDRANEELPGFGSTIFNTITDSLNGCKGRHIVLRANVASGYFEENVILTNDQKNFYIASTVLNPAIVVGSHEIETDAKNITFRGIEFVHSAENNKPLFNIRKDENSDLREMRILNCILDGSGCRKCGIFDTKRLSFLTINYTSIVDWSFFALKLDDIDELVMSGNVVDECEGRCFLIKFKGGYWIERMTLIRVRGGEDLKGAALISLTAKDDDLCDPNDPSPVRRCLLRDIVQHVNVTDPDYRDVGIYMAKGSIIPENFYDIWIRKARNGFVGLKLNNVNAANLRTKVMPLNPGIRSSLFQNRRDRSNRRNVGTDYVLRGVSESAIFDGEGFVFTNNVETDFDEFPGFLVPINPIICESNPNWALETGLGPGLTLPRMGLNRFANASIMVEFCEDRRTLTSINPDLDLDEDTMSSDMPTFIGYVRSFNGTRLVPEQITFLRAGWLIGDDTGSVCKSPNFRPGIVGLGHRVLAYNWNITNLEFFMPNVPLPRLPIWSSGLLDYPDDTLSGVSDTLEIIVPDEVVVTDCVFSGRGILPLEQAWALDFFMGRIFEESILKADDNELPPFTNAFVVVVDSFFQDWAAYTQEDQGGFEFVNEEFPFTGGVRFQYRNRLNSDTRFLIHNTTMRDMDYGGVAVYHANHQNVSDSQFYNCSGRAFGNFACVYMVGNNVFDLLEPSRIRDNNQVYLDTPIETYFDRVVHLNTWDLLYRRDDRAGQPAYVHAYHFDGHPNSSIAFCIRNSTAFGLSGGLRLENVENKTFINCPTFNQAVFFPDRARYLRTLCIEGRLDLLAGFSHWLTDGPGSTDVFWEGRYCDNACCFLVPPEECFVTNSPDLLSPQNPWLGDGDGVDDYVFGSINAAILGCSAERRVINIIGREDPFEFDFENKIYVETISVSVPLVSVNGVGGPIRIIGYAGSTVLGSGHSVVTNGVQTTFETVRFSHNGGTAATWEQTALASDADGLRFIGCIFRAEGVVNELAVDILVGDPFEMRSNIIEGEGSQLAGVRITSPGDCLQYPHIHKNVFNDILGYGLSVTGTLARINDNEFDDVGGRDLITSSPYGVYFNPGCPEDPSRKNSFKKNELVTMQTAVAALGRMAAFWLDFNGEDDTYMRVEENRASGMEIGIRFENMLDDSPSDDRKLQLRTFALTDMNLRADGTWHDLVRGSPVDDIDIDTDPTDPANIGRFCDNGCPNNRLIFGILFATLFGLLVLCCLCLCCFLLTRKSSASMYSSTYLEEDVPTSAFKRMAWSPNDHSVDPNTYGSTPAHIYQNPYQAEKQYFKQNASLQQPANMVSGSRSGASRRRKAGGGSEETSKLLTKTDENDLQV